MKVNVTILIAMFLVLVGGVLYADEWDSIEKLEFFSPKGQHMLKIVPHENWPNKPGHCKATLFKIDGEKRKEVWSRYLINDHAPVQIFVADSGNYVITMDEWHHVGDLPIVIYGLFGSLIKVHSTDSLGLKEDIEHIKLSVSSYWWNEDSIGFFGPNENTFIIRLHWGKLILLELNDGSLMDKEWYDISKGWLMPKKKWDALHSFAEGQVKEHALRLLDSGDAEERKTGALVCGQEKIVEAIPRLKELLADSKYYTTNIPRKWTRVYYVRKAAEEALKILGEKQQ